LDEVPDLAEYDMSKVGENMREVEAIPNTGKQAIPAGLVAGAGIVN
jgi:hypothetical protein